MIPHIACPCHIHMSASFEGVGSKVTAIVAFVLFGGR